MLVTIQQAWLYTSSLQPRQDMQQVHMQRVPNHLHFCHFCLASCLGMACQACVTDVVWKGNAGGAVA